MGNISVKEDTYSFWDYVKGQGHRQFLWVFYIPFSNATLCCNNWNTFLQKTFKLGQNVCLDKILVKFEYGSSEVCLSVRPSVCLHFLCAAITGILFNRELSNFIRMFLWTRSWSSPSGVCLFICPHFLCAVITGILFYRELSNFVYGPYII